MGICSMATDPVVAEDRTVSTSSISSSTNSSSVFTASSSTTSSSSSHTGHGNDVVPVVVSSSTAQASTTRVNSKAVEEHGDIKLKRNSADVVMTTADLQSDATVNSSERSSSVSSEDEDESGEFGCDEYGEDDNDVCDPSQRRFLLKPMPTLLQVCPVDDLAVEEEKRRRRHSQRNSSNSGHGKGKNAKRTCADAESLPSAPSPLLLRSSKQDPGTMAATTPRGFASGSRSNPNSPQFGPAAAPTGGVPPQLRRDSMAIRQQYWKQLGFNLTRSDLERTTGRKKERQKGLKVRLNDAPTKKGESKNFFQFIASWYGANNSSQQVHKADSEEEKIAAANGQRERRSSRSSRRTDESVTIQSSSAALTGPSARKTIHFNEEAELFYIPLHKDYSKRQRDCMWHTRVEFISMVERNLEDVYEEMEREYEEQLEAEYLENEAMAREEARQRKIEAEQKAKEASKVKAAVAAEAAKKQQQQQQQQAVAAAAAAASIRSRSPSQSPSTRGQPLSGSGASSTAAGSTSPTAGPIPTLSLCPIETQIKLAPRGRSTHDIRFKYLKHLGIQNT